MNDTKTVVTQSVGSSFPIMSILTIIFVLARLAGVIQWSWWWVLAPLWMPISIAIGVLSLVVIFVGIMALIAACLD